MIWKAQYANTSIYLSELSRSRDMIFFKKCELYEITQIEKIDYESTIYISNIPYYLVLGTSVYHAIIDKDGFIKTATLSPKPILGIVWEVLEPIFST
tara:strand:- start:280 stop:570 length:291 start_codon:yes stop_codon:yes gene_type:complete